MSDKGINMLKGFEGCELEAYQDLVGKWTIGYGHTNNVKKGDKITQAQAETYLKQDLASFTPGVAKLLKVTVTQSQFDALVDFAYNLGLGNLQKSTLLKLVNAKHWTDASKEFVKWDRAGDKEVSSLTKRRTAEMNMFLNK